jgi:hypothetical protein
MFCKDFGPYPMFVSSATALAIEADTAQRSNSIQVSSNSNIAAKFVDDLQKIVSAARDSMEGSLLLDPNVELEGAPKTTLLKR